MGVRTRDEINNIKTQITLSTIVGSEVDLRLSRGRDFKGPCPFHTEKTASFHVDDQRYHCFGCHAHGDIFSWISLTKGVSFGQAITLAEELIGTTPAPVVRKKEAIIDDPIARERIIKTCTKANHLFCELIPANSTTNRIPFESKVHWRIGYAPRDRLALPKLLRSEGVTDDEMVEAQLCARDVDTNEVYSRYRERMTIPLKDRTGRILGFLGRIISSEATAKLPKYLCPRNSAAFNKKHFIFGLDQIPTGRVESLIVVEGTIDAIALWTKGITNVVSTLGCDLSKEQAVILGNITDKVYMMYDGDQAGINGMADVGQRELPFQCRALLLPYGTDPDTYSSKLQGSAVDSLRLLPNIPIRALSTPRLHIRTMSKIEYDISILQKIAKPYVEDNIKQGLYQYNVVDWVCQAYPQYAPLIKAALKTMLDNAEFIEGGTKRRLMEGDVKAFLKEWIKACRDVRRNNAN